MEKDVVVTKESQRMTELPGEDTLGLVRSPITRGMSNKPANVRESLDGIGRDGMDDDNPG